MKTLLEMTPAEQTEARQWFARWKAASATVDKVRADEIRSCDTAAAMEMLDGMFDHAARDQGPRETSGLLEQQAIFARARR